MKNDYFFFFALAAEIVLNCDIFPVTFIELALLVLSKFNKKSSEFVSLNEFKNYYCKHYKEALSLFNFLSVDAATNREL